MSEDKLSFSVQGMTCASCVRNVERSLKKIEGVKFVSVNLATEKAVIIKEGKINFDEIEKSVKKVGYKASKEMPSEDMIEKNYKHDKFNLIFSLILTIPISILMLFHMSGLKIPYYNYLELIIGAINIFYLGQKTLKGAWIAISHFHTNMDTLVIIGALSSYITTILNMTGMDVMSFGALASMLITLHLLGRFIESNLKSKASKEIKSLIKLKVENANVINGENVEKVPLETVKIGSLILVKKGEKIPLDGKIIEGKGLVDESMITGEPLSIKKSENSKVVGGTILEEGLLKVEVENVGEETFLNQMIKLVEEAQSTKVPIQAFADRITLFFIPIVLSLAIISSLVWYFNYENMQEYLVNMSKYIPWLVVDAGAVSTSIFVFVSTLVIACPCALGLATPMALVAGSGAAARKGLIIKNGGAIQAAKDIDTILLDKTGTITQGKPTVVFQNIDKFYHDIIYTIESNSNHPLAKSIYEYYENKKDKKIDLNNFEEITGKGVQANYENNIYFIGKPKNYKIYEEYMEKGHTVVEFRENEEIKGFISIADPIKEQAEDAIKELKTMGIMPIMITGDSEITAKAVAKQVGIETIYSGVSPKDKVDKVRELQISGKKVAMVGDGINDAAALKSSDISMAIGTGTDLAIESADIISVKGEFSKIIDSIKISKITFSKIRQNLFWAFFYNVIAIPLAMSGLLHPAISEIAMTFSSINVILNSLRIKKLIK
ncbi:MULTISPECIES: heavy metal translocating P-type ATPase [Oceanotoga]|jgi:Cu+-exporting ATPase|uniref:heavy metal translocating P-type ATPase n=1 Tax=Oceanotoga TaxID=1255275 RepID=UPI002655475C|nr:MULTISPECIES: cation-translocating P-type ATPase [Oceanotoga]MDN5341865.1 P-type Cu+ transporter [Oceanotoga sp.]MDO7976654.1 cation-translocating P-type ATPase [Oceanotoga teriensis]